MRWWVLGLCSAIVGAADDRSNWCEGFDEFVLTADVGLEPKVGGSRLLPNMTFNNSVAQDAYVYYQLCIARHNHEHAIEVDLVSITGDTNMYLSPETPLPQRGRAAWIAQRPGNDHVSLPTYLPEFPRHGQRVALYIGVLGTAPGDSNFTLTVSIRDLPQNADIQSRQDFYDKSRVQLQAQRRLRQNRG
ncbi:hypothetical protein ACHHYP_01282 [Achlya hypogyna]|uniref:Secreted protein n=1 Tax=Achlya hypogyna TaxID=1202772 RepID=A0A0A7CLR4_ACHHY|nr:secreted protein [Achlya hypogyna]OQR94434.1 hypothetical protein ACHHYP_01282 [Achlya hypogyna]